MGKVAKNAKNKRASGRMFTFGEPESVLDKRMIWGYQGVTKTRLYYEPPISPKILGNMVNVAAHHRSAIGLKQRLLTRDFIPHKYLSRSDFSRWVYDYLVMGNNYLEREDNMLGDVMALKPMPAVNTRRGIEDGVFYWLEDNFKPTPRPKGKVFHLKEHDILQEIYGTPEYLAAVNSALLNESSTLFRRKYYKNGSHAGFILFITDEEIPDEDIDALEEKLKSTKGIGNFDNLLLHAPGGKPDGVKLIPIAQVGAADEFLSMKNVTAKDILTVHRVPPLLLGVMPDTAGSRGDVEKDYNTYFRMEMIAMQETFKELNDWIGEEVIQFKPFVPFFTPKTDTNNDPQPQ